MALIVLVEKLNVTGLELSQYSKAERAHVCNNALRDNYKKVDLLCRVYNKRRSPGRFFDNSSV